MKVIANDVGRSKVLCLVALFLCLLMPARYTAAPIGRRPDLAVQHEPETIGQRIQKAREAISEKRYDDAKRELRVALSLDKNSPVANLCLAFVHKQENRPKDAIKCVQTAIKSQPNYPDAHYLFAQLLFEKQDLARSREEIDLAITQGMSIRNAFVLSGDIYLAQSNNKLAVESYEKALGLPGGDDGTTLRDLIGALTNNIDFASHRGEPSYVKPRQLNAPRPVYTYEARSRGIQGKVKSGIRVDEQGKVSHVVIFSGLGYGLDSAAVKAAQALLFSPATREGKPVAYWLNLIIEFNLKMEIIPIRN